MWWHRWVLGLCVSHKAVVQLSLGTVVTLRLNPSKLTHLVVGRTRVLMGSGSEGLSCSVAAGCRPCGLSIRSSRHSRSSHQREVTTRNVTPSFLPHYIHWKQSSRSSPHSRVGGYTKTWTPRGTDHRSHWSKDYVSIHPGVPSFLQHTGLCPSVAPPDHAPQQLGHAPSSLCSSVTSSGMLSLTLNPSCSLFLLPSLLFFLILGNFEQTPT